MTEGEAIPVSGHRQASACGAALAEVGPFDEIWTSPLRRAVETAVHIAEALGMPDTEIQRDDRIQERMNWPGEPRQSHADFAREWARATADRDVQPAFGDSSRAAGARFAAFLADLHDRLPDGRAIVVAHCGVTVDLVRPRFGDGCVEALAPGAIEHGILACAVTMIAIDGKHSTLRRIGADATSLAS